MAEKKYKSFSEFYPYYLTEHALAANRTLHFIGTALVIGLLCAFFYTLDWKYFILTPLAGYGFAWVGHFFLERNKPATFTYPLWSLGSDFVMFYHIITGQIHRRLEEAHKIIGTQPK